jgi:hypothetical protein
VRQERGGPASARAGQGRAAMRQPAPGPSRLGQMLRPVLSFAGNRPGLVFGVVAALGTTGAIGWNALHQANRHPAPLFKPAAAKQAEAPRRTETAAVAPAPMPAAIPVPAPRPDPVTVGSLAASQAAAPAPVARASASDPIGNLIRGGSEPAPPARTAAEIRPDPRVTAVQKALSKIGYGPLKADGFLGTTTRQALERFERDHKLPVTGGLGTRTTRQLASASGTQIE